jgi:transposase-like protein
MWAYRSAAEGLAQPGWGRVTEDGRANMYLHLPRNSFKYASKRDWAHIAKDLKPVYTSASEAEELDRLAEFGGK